MKIKGTKSILKFTYIQGIKAKAFKISTALMGFILLILILCANFIPTLIGEVEGLFSQSNETSVKTIFLLDKSGVFKPSDLYELYDMGIGITVITEEKLPEIKDAVKQSGEAEILISINNNDGRYSVLTERPESEEKIKLSDCSIINGIVSASIERAHLLSIGVPAKNLDKAKPIISNSVIIAGEKPQSEVEIIFDYAVPIVTSLAFFMFIFMYGTMVANAVAGEKTSRVIELLLTSVDPLAIIIGKIFATLLISITQILILSAIGFITFIISAPFGILGQLTAQSTNIDVSYAANEMSAFLAGIDQFAGIKIIVVFVLGFLLFAFIAGLIGAGVSRAEDLQSALQPLSLLGVLGFYLSYFPFIFNFSGERKTFFITFAYYFPLSSPFSLPAGIISGHLSEVDFLVAALILFIVDLLLLLLIARVYERVIFYTGNKPGLKGILSIKK
ncbi:MAG: ABC transporter permease [Eubacterium sp.]|jgi:ABC-2 type transport system permease protein|nr:ABC transporter permease [Eubacterium sp.]